MEYDLEVAAGTDASLLSLEIAGANSLDVDRGALAISTPQGTLVQRPPRVIQGGRVLRTRYVIEGDRRVAFAIEGYDKSQSILIDPVIIYSTYLGGSSDEPVPAGGPVAVTVDSAGAAYVVSSSTSIDFPTSSTAYQKLPGGVDAGVDGGTSTSINDVTITKIDATGARAYSTYLGGTAVDNGTGVGVDASGNVVVVGYTSSFDFPTVAAYQTNFAGNQDAFVAKLDSTGSHLLFSSFIGGSASDIASGVAVDASGIYLCGNTSSTNYPTKNPIQGSLLGAGDAFITKLDPSGSTLVYSTYLGGTSPNLEAASAIAVDATGAAYVAGTTSSSDFPTVAAFQKTFAGYEDAFVAKLDPTGTALVFSTYLGGKDDEELNGTVIAVDGVGDAYVTGLTQSADFPTMDAYQAKFGGFRDAFITKFSSAGAVVFSTYFGGTGVDFGAGIAVDSTNAFYVVGRDQGSSGFPTLNPLSVPTGVEEAFLAKFDPTGKTLLYSTPLGADQGSSVAVSGTNASSSGPSRRRPFRRRMHRKRHSPVAAISSSCKLLTTPAFRSSLTEARTPRPRWMQAPRRRQLVVGVVVRSRAGHGP